VTTRAAIPTSPPTKQNAIATHSATSVIGGSAVLLKSGHGRCNRPEVCVIFVASQRLSVRVSMAIIAAAPGATATIASTTRSRSPLEPASASLRISSSPRRSVLLMVSASVPRVSSTAIVVRTAKPATHSRMRPTGYHSTSAVGWAATLPATAASGRPSRAR
jgi:hypothetical protein